MKEQHTGHTKSSPKREVYSAKCIHYKDQKEYK